MLMYKLNKICTDSLCWKLHICIEGNPEFWANHTVLIAATVNIVKMLTVQKLIIYPVQSQTKPELAFKNHKADSKRYWEANWKGGWEEPETKAGTKIWIWEDGWAAHGVTKETQRVLVEPIPDLKAEPDESKSVPFLWSLLGPGFPSEGGTFKLKLSTPKVHFMTK